MESVPTGSTGVDFVLMPAPTGPVSGRVLLTDGTPAAQARVELWQAGRQGRDGAMDDGRLGSPYRVTHADEAGAFSFPRVRHGRYGLDVLPAPPSGSERDVVYVAARQRVSELELSPAQLPGFQEIILAPMGTVRVLATQSAYDALLEETSGPPHVLLRRVDLARARLQLSIGTPELRPGRPIVFHGVTTGHYVASTLRTSFREVVQITGNDHLEVHVQTAPAQVQGRVYRAGSPLAGCAVTLIHENETVAQAARGTSDAEGRFALSGVRDGPWFVRLDAPAAGTTFLRTFVKPGEELRLDWPTGQLRIEAGELVETGRTTVLAIEVAGLGLDWIPEQGRVVTSFDPGSVDPIAVTGLEEGVYEVRITAPDGQALASREIRTSAALTVLRFDS